MPQDQHAKQRYEHEREERKERREEQAADRAVNDAALEADNHTGQQGLLPTDQEPVEGTEIKQLRDMLPEFTNDQLRRIRLVPRGTRLKPGAHFCDVRFRERGEVVAHGEEEVHDELLVAKNDVDYEIWDKLLGDYPRAGETKNAKP